MEVLNAHNGLLLPAVGNTNIFKKIPLTRVEISLYIFLDTGVMPSQIAVNSTVYSNGLYRLITTEKSNLRFTGPFYGNPLITHGFPSQRAGNMESLSLSWRNRIKCRTHTSQKTPGESESWFRGIFLDWQVWHTTLGVHVHNNFNYFRTTII